MTGSARPVRIGEGAADSATDETDVREKGRGADGEAITSDRRLLMERAGIGRAFGCVGLGYDVRLACCGLDKSDNGFVIGLIGSELLSLSVFVQRMRETKQTSLHLDRLGPFFVGKAVWQSAR